jgi:hypothetical protein
MNDSDHSLVEKRPAGKSEEGAGKAPHTDESARRELQEKILELERFHRLFMGREQRIVELKREANALTSEAGRVPPYNSLEQIDCEEAPDQITSATTEPRAGTGSESEELRISALRTLTSCSHCWQTSATRWG